MPVVSLSCFYCTDKNKESKKNPDDSAKTVQYPVSEIAARFLVGEGRSLLTSLAEYCADEYAASLWLHRQNYDVDTISMAVSVFSARRKAKQRFPNADKLFLTTEMLAQATSPTIAAYHASVLAPLQTVTDLCCGAGLDSIAFAQAGMCVVAVEKDAARLIFARANAETFGVADRITFLQADALHVPIETAAVYADPARRTEGGSRVSRHGDLYEPPLTVLAQIISAARGGGLKLSPLLPDDVLNEQGGRVEFLSENREGKEACLWFGDVENAGGRANRASAVLLPERIAIAGSHDTPPIRPIGAYLLEPDPAIIRANGLAEAARFYNAGAISAADVYLTSDALPDNFRVASVFRLVADLPYKPKEIAAFVRRAGLGRVVVKKRRALVEPEAVLKAIKASSGGPAPEGTLVIVRTEEGHRALFVEPVRKPD